MRGRASTAPVAVSSLVRSNFLRLGLEVSLRRQRENYRDGRKHDRGAVVVLSCGTAEEALGLRLPGPLKCEGVHVKLFPTPHPCCVIEQLDDALT